MSASTDQFLVTPIEDQKGSSAIFEVPTSELKKKYTFCSTQEKSLPGTPCYTYFMIYVIIIIYSNLPM